MAVKKSVKKAPNGGDQSHPHAALGGTLEDYFNSKKSYQSDEMKELNKEVTKHLLTGSGANNAMVMEKEEPQESATAKDGGGEPEEKKEEDEGEDHYHDRVSDSDSGGGGDDDYEDDYESDSSTAADKSVAGMTLGDYLHAKGDGVLPAEGTESKKQALPVEKLPQKPNAASKKPLPPAVISGMSLDYYLGASAAAAGDDGELAMADSKSPPRNKKKQTKGKGKPGFLAALPARQAPHDSKTYQDEEFVTPYQKRMTKKHKLKQQQQQHMVQGGSAAKSILLGDSHSSSQLLLAKQLPGSSSSSTPQPKDKKKLHHNGSSGSNPPLPKLLGSSPSAHGFLPPGKAHSDTEDGDGTGDDHDSAADEKLPPLQHQQHAANK